MTTRFGMIVLSFLFLLLPLAAQPDLRPPIPKVALPVQEKMDLTTPATALRSFTAALNRYDFAQMAQCVADSKPVAVDQYGPFVEQFKKMSVQILISEPRLRVQGDMASATFFSQFKIQVAPKNPPVEQPAQPERVLLRLVDGQWKVVGDAARMRNPGKPAVPIQGLEPGDGFLTMIASFLANPDIMKQAVTEAQPPSCISNLKQLALDVMLMRQDFDETFAFAKAAQKFPAADEANRTLGALLDQDWQKALYPYAKTPQLFFCPERFESTKRAPLAGEEDAAKLAAENAKKAEIQARRDKLMADLGMPRQGEPYVLNAFLDGLKRNVIVKPAETVLFYEGDAGKLDFRHNGKAHIAFCDGHVAAIGPEDARKLIWNPKGKNP